MIIYIYIYIRFLLYKNIDVATEIIIMYYTYYYIQGVSEITLTNHTVLFLIKN